jgi:Lrp/AsnC family transcriptional regulator, leucine-responsive regulatory protein
MKPLKIDAIDRKILRILQKEGRLPNARLAERVGLSPPSVLERVRKLEERGVIRGYKAEVEEDLLGMKATVFVSVTLSFHNSEVIDNFQRIILEMPEVIEAHHVTGEDDYLLKVVLPDIGAYESFLLDTLTRIEGVNKVKSSFVLSKLKRGGSLPLQADG